MPNKWMDVNPQVEEIHMCLMDNPHGEKGWQERVQEYSLDFKPFSFYETFTSPCAAFRHYEEFKVEMLAKLSDKSLYHVHLLGLGTPGKQSPGFKLPNSGPSVDSYHYGICRFNLTTSQGAVVVKESEPSHIELIHKKLKWFFDGHDLLVQLPGDFFVFPRQVIEYKPR